MPAKGQVRDKTRGLPTQQDINSRRERLNIALRALEIPRLETAEEREKVIGELDSDHHDSRHARLSDAARDDDLRAAGHSVIRFRHREMWTDGHLLATRIRLLLDPEAA